MRVQLPPPALFLTKGVEESEVRSCDEEEQRQRMADPRRSESRAAPTPSSGTLSYNGFHGFCRGKSRLISVKSMTEIPLEF